MQNKLNEQLARQKVFDAVKEYYRETETHKAQYRAGDRIPCAGRVYDGTELEFLVDASLDFWLTAGRYADRFENEFSKFLGIRFSSLVNSGSSANLLAFMALTSPELGERRIARGDEVITVACGFPTTVSPIVQYGAVPVFVDVTLPSYNIDCEQLEPALSSKTKAVMVAHTMGNPFDIKAVKTFCDRHGLWLVEDNCDALGAKYNLDGVWQHTGTFGDIATASFYPAHHITMGEGGAVYTDNPQLHRIINSLRDWGRDCSCPPGVDDRCGNRFSRQFGELPAGYDHKYVYSHFGYNLKATDMQAAIGCAQLMKMPDFIAKRRENWQQLRAGLERLEEYFILPQEAPDTEPSWFGFLITVRPEAPFSRNEITQHLENAGVQTRTLFAGNLVKHPCFDEMRKTGSGYRVVGNLHNTDIVMNRTFWIGVYPGIDGEKTDYIVSAISARVEQSV